jgi:L-iditol 2-dehydrogenase
MKAAVLYGPRDLRVSDLPSADPAPGEVVLRIESAMTCATDVKMFERGHPALGPYPARFGHEFAGVVEACGAGVSNLRPGDAVFCADSGPCGACSRCEEGRPNLCEHLQYLLGGFAEQLVVPPAIASVNIHRLPPGLPMERAPMAEPLACALLAVERAAPPAGNTAIVMGAGSIGLFLSAALRTRGCDPIVLDPHNDRLDLAGSFGAASCVRVSRTAEDVKVGRALRASYVFEAVGRPQAWEQAVQMPPPGGTVVFVGGCQRDATVTVPAFRLHYEEITLQGSYHHTPRHIAAALELLTDESFRWDALVGPPVGLGALSTVLASGKPSSTGHHKQRVDPRC